MVQTRGSVQVEHNPHKMTKRTRAPAAVPKAKVAAPKKHSKTRVRQDALAASDVLQFKAKKSNKTEYFPKTGDPNRKIGLLNLPRDVFREIISWLEPDAMTCLSLTCKEILNLVGTDSWALCHSKRQSYDQTKKTYVCFRDSMIPLLGHDSGWVNCFPCMTLHPPLKPPRSHRQTKLTKTCFGQWCVIDYLPKDSDGGGYSLLWEHIVEARKSMLPNDAGKVGSPIELLAGEFTLEREKLIYTLTSSGQQIGKNLVLKHQHVFRGKDPRSPIKAADISALNLHICPHQTTSTQKPEPGRYTKGRLPSRLLTHSIAMAAPPSSRQGMPAPNFFSATISSEQKQMDAVAAGTSRFWACRSCPTKWKVQYNNAEEGAGAGEFRITAWHSFGDTAYRAQEYYKMLVRREMPNLGDEKRNSEFYAGTKQYLGDFVIDDDE